MGRTNWAAIILGGGVLVGGAYVFLNWKKLCPDILGAENCTGDNPITDILAINSLPAIDRGNTRYSAPNTAIPQGTTTATIGGKKVTETRTSASKPLSQNYLNATKRNAGTPAGGTSGPNGTGYNCNSVLCKNYPSNCPGCKKANYTDFSSFATITLNRVSVK